MEKKGLFGSFSAEALSLQPGLVVVIEVEFAALYLGAAISPSASFRCVSAALVRT